MDAKRERATFDPEVAVHEEEADLEYLGYDEVRQLARRGRYLFNIFNC
jgi:hypothetical protein